MHTPRRDVAYRALSPDLSPSDYILWVLSAIQGATPLSSLSPFQQMCHIIPRLTLATKCSRHVIIPPMHRTSRSGHTPRLKYHVYASPQHVATYQVDLPVLNFSSWKVTCPQFPSFNRSFCARRINATRESLFQKLARRNNATPPPFFCDLKRRNKATSPYICVAGQTCL